MWRCADARGVAAPELHEALTSWTLLEEYVHTPTVTVARRQDPHGGMVVVKRYRFPRRLRRIEAAFRHTWLLVEPKARAETRALLRMRELGVPTVEPLGYGWVRDPLGFVADSFLLTRWCPHPDLARTLRERGPPAPEAWRALGESLAVMHARGVCHGGLAPRNVLLGAAEDGRWQARWLDPARTRFRPRRLATAEAERDLDALRPTLDAAPFEARTAFEEGYCSPSFRNPSANAGRISSASPTTP
jgi:tRNA A-37 threonylcarbamoyl transferase component Bud32